MIPLVQTKLFVMVVPRVSYPAQVLASRPLVMHLHLLKVKTRELFVESCGHEELVQVEVVNVVNSLIFFYLNCQQGYVDGNLDDLSYQASQP